MRIEDLKSRTAIRLAIAFSGLYVVTVTLLLALLYFSISNSLETDIRGRVIETQDALLRVDLKQGFKDLSQVVTSEAASVRDADSIFLLQDENGAFVAGNIHQAPRFTGWRLLDRRAFPAIQDIGHPDDRFYAIWRPVSQGFLLVGANDRTISETTATLFHVLIWGVALAIIIPALLGTLLARRAQRKIDALGSTLAAVAEGHISRRVPVEGSSDDLDHVAMRINHTLDQLHNLILGVNQTSSDIAHDLKHPIGRLRQKLDEARVNAQSVEEFRTATCRALGEIDTIVETFEALLRITQLEAGAGKKRFAPLDMKELLGDLADAYGAVIEDEGFRLETSIDTRCDAFISGDRELLTQLFANLIENAIRHTPKGTLISLRLMVDDRNLTVTLRDTGPGIPEAEREKVFRRLYRLEKSRSTPGSGLGLSLVAAIVQLHGAKITLSDSQPGLCVQIVFPRIIQTASANLSVRMGSMKAQADAL